MSLPAQQQDIPLLQLIESWIEAMRQQKAAFDATSIRRLCQDGTIRVGSPEYNKLVELQLAISAYNFDVNGCIGVCQQPPA